MELRKYLVPEIVYGDNSINLIGKYARNYNAEKILLVTDEGIIKAGWTEKIQEILKKNQLDYCLYSNITPNPKDSEVNEGAKVYIKEKCNLIIAVGGGSVIDCAKGIGIVCTNNKNINEFEGVDNVRVPMPPLICIPTTSGSSADISQFAIILNQEKQKKIAIISKALVPDVAIIDAVVTTTMDEQLTANTGMDALVHAIEAYVSNASSIITDINAIKAIELISQNLIKAINEPLNLTYRNHIMMGSMLAGMAFSNASLGIIHAMAHSLGGITNLPHGECNAILVENCIDYNFDQCPDKYRDIYLALGGDDSTTDIKNALLKKISEIRKEAGIADSFHHHNLNSIDSNQLAQNTYEDPCIVTNPKPISIEQIKLLFDKLIY